MMMNDDNDEADDDDNDGFGEDMIACRALV